MGNPSTITYRIFIIIKRRIGCKDKHWNTNLDKLKGIEARTTPDAQDFYEAVQNLKEPVVTDAQAPTIIAIEGFDYSNRNSDCKEELPRPESVAQGNRKGSKSKSKKRGSALIWFALGTLAFLGIGFIVANSSANSDEFRKSETV